MEKLENWENEPPFIKVGLYLLFFIIGLILMIVIIGLLLAIRWMVTFF